MKGTAWLLGLFFALLLLLPCLALFGGQAQQATAAPTIAPSAAPPSAKPAASGKAAASAKATASKPASQAPVVQQTDKRSGKSFRIFDKTAGKVLAVDELDFLRGTVGTEMSPDSPPEALKAQAVAAYTYYSRLRVQRAAKPDASIQGADFACETGKWLSYATKQQMQQRWGANFYKYWSNLAPAVEAAYGQALYSGGQLLDATYFAISSGRTENAVDVWGAAVPCLQAVASPGDVYAAGYLSTVQLNQQQFATAAQRLGCSLSGDPSKWVGQVQRSASGGVKTLVLGGKTVKGTDARAAFGLRSTNFDLSCAGGNFTFAVRGWGHGVGMSQAGAIDMARQGASYQEILAWYYPGSQLQKR